ncbi:MAG: hypothetical protein IJF43_01120, partial [Firmicutes bacterium]|nr:hypothetical protein [Bacillota bacterium]
MDYIIWGLIAAAGAIVLFSILNFLIKLLKPAGSAQQGIWNAVYFIQLKQYKKALTILEDVEAEFGMTPEVMCDFCKQKAAALKGLDRNEEAAKAYDVMLDALKNVEGRIHRNEEFLAEIKACYTACGRETDFTEWETFFENLPEWIEVDFRKATEEDLDRIAEIYDRIHTEEEAGTITTGWKREIYPTRQTAEEAIQKGELYVEIANDILVAAAKINRDQEEVYAEGDWEFDADQDQVLVLHTLVVDPNEKERATAPSLF